MIRDNCQKIKLLKLIELLRQESGPENPLRTSIICKKLIGMGISVDRRTLSKDIELLNEYGYDIHSRLIVHEKGYYVEDNSFSVAELKIIIDAVQAATFVTDNKTKDLVNRIASLSGSSKKEILKGNIVCFNTRKHSNEEIYENVEVLEKALLRHSKASFYYFDLNENGDRVYRKNKDRYMVEPMALIFHEDNYYLMTWSSKYDAINNYRVDRMEGVLCERDHVSEKAIMEDTDIAKFTEQAFKMYGGPVTRVTLEFDDTLIGSVYDKFGEHINITRISPNECSVTLEVQESPTFKGWLCQFGEKMRVVE